MLYFIAACTVIFHTHRIISAVLLLAILVWFVRYLLRHLRLLRHRFGLSETTSDQPLFPTYHLKQNPLIPDVGALITRDPHNPFVCTDPYLAQSRFSATFANP